VTGAVSCFVPVIVVVTEVIVNVSVRVRIDPMNVPSLSMVGGRAGVVCGPMVIVPSATNVPGYGPVAAPSA